MQSDRKKSDKIGSRDDADVAVFSRLFLMQLQLLLAARPISDAKGEARRPQGCVA